MSNNPAFRPAGRPTVLAFYSLHPPSSPLLPAHLPRAVFTTIWGLEPESPAGLRAEGALARFIARPAELESIESLLIATPRRSRSRKQRRARRDGDDRDLAADRLPPLIVECSFQRFAAATTRDDSLEFHRGQTRAITRPGNKMRFRDSTETSICIIMNTAETLLAFTGSESLRKTRMAG